MDVNEVIIKPVLSEKSTQMAELGKYVFRVAMKANKVMIKRAVKEIFDVETEQVNVIRVRGRRKRVRYKYGYTASWKKAIVTLKKGQKIELFEGQ
ncbi:MAG TPA: 50S ribosomal protein L23 [Spirochaetota bacterium]|nr:50S ribosomal protein L23 [Spirochaetota bacterium]HQP48046.1 50S ribosomal protein L23 [Spirochaetota bacterium]